MTTLNSDLTISELTDRVVLNDKHELKRRYWYAAEHGKDHVLLLDCPIRKKLGLVSTPTSLALPPGTPKGFNGVVSVTLPDLVTYIESI